MPCCLEKTSSIACCKARSLSMPRSALRFFRLDGFASDETQEYIRFKLATARFTKELPIDGGIVGAIHNSSLRHARRD